MIRNASVKILALVLAVLISSAAALAQSTDQSYPTPVTSNEISGTIKARDIGDSRETTFYFLIDGDQGDVFLNVVTKNLDGSIDVFSAESLRPMTKITVYSDSADGETGRVVYLREAQKLLLRIEGRTPTDDPATFRIKLAGSFKPFNAAAVAAQPKAPQVRSLENGEVRVSSTGAIIETKPSPTPKVAVAKVEKEKPSEPAVKPARVPVETAKPEKPKAPVDAPAEATDKVEKKEPSGKKPTTAKTKVPAKTQPVAKPEKPDSAPSVAEKPKNNEPKETKKPEPAKKKEPQPVDPAELANVNLVVLFKDGRKIERPMSEVLRFGVDRGILTVVARDGSIGRYSILDIEKITIE